MFTYRRGSPNTLSLEEEVELRVPRINEMDINKSPKSIPNQRILSFKEKRSRPSLSL